MPRQCIFLMLENAATLLISQSSLIIQQYDTIASAPRSSSTAAGNMDNTKLSGRAEPFQKLSSVATSPNKSSLSLFGQQPFGRVALLGNISAARIDDVSMIGYD